jgi:hypothetical protein
MITRRTARPPTLLTRRLVTASNIVEDGALLVVGALTRADNERFFEPPDEVPHHGL